MTAMKNTDSFAELSATLEQSRQQWIQLGEICERIRREHPDWFDPTTGYLITDTDGDADAKP